MRTERIRRPVNDGPSCCFCAVNYRRFRQSFCTLGVVFLMGILAVCVSYYFQENSYKSDGITDSKVLQKFDYIDYQIDGLLKTIGKIQGAMEVYKTLGGPKEDKIMGLIKNELNIYDSDKTGIPDFALENLGGCILSTKNTISRMESLSVTFFGYPLWSRKSNPRAIIRPGTLPGECWAFEGRGEVIIKLMSEIFVTAVSLEHISRNLSPFGDISSAPKIFELFGISCLDDNKQHKFGSFTYLDDGPPLQMFEVQNPAPRTFGIVEVHFNSNYGNKEYTCVYRVRIHGKVPEQMGDG